MILEHNTLREGIPYDTGNGIKEEVYEHIKDKLHLCDDTLDLHFGGVRESRNSSYQLSLIFQITEKDSEGSLTDSRLQYFDVAYNVDARDIMLWSAIENIDELINEDQELKLRCLGV